MKTLRISLMAIVLTAGVAGAFATKVTNHKATDTQLYWFDASGQYVDHGYAADQGCSTGNTVCERGYSSIDGSGNPVGSPVQTLKQP